MKYETTKMVYYDTMSEYKCIYVRCKRKFWFYIFYYIQYHPLDNLNNWMAYLNTVIIILKVDKRKQWFLVKILKFEFN